ncbi:MAG: LPS export ABC transporter ATP-binding protein [Vampirovibrionales bacterium]
MMMLTVRHVHKTYGKRAVVRDVSFTVQAAEIVGLLGPNGAGKTTSFYMVVGVVQPDCGDILFEGQSIKRLPMHERTHQGLGYLPQETSVFRGLTALDNLRLVLELQGLSAKQQHDQAFQLLEEFGLTKLANTLALQLSGGERRRLEIARALAANPRLLLLDEPFTGIDPITIEELQHLIQRLRQERGLSILITDHNPQATLKLIDRAYVMFDGQVVFEGDRQAVAESSMVKSLYLGEGFQLV